MRKIIAGAVLATVMGLGFAAAPAVVTPASAQGIVIGPDGVRVYPGERGYDRYDRRYRRDVDRRDAEYIARRNGVDRVRNVSRRGGDWVVVGEARRGRGDLRVRIDGRSGRVINVDRIIRR
jgi:hypothetical protein